LRKTTIAKSLGAALAAAAVVGASGGAGAAPPAQGFSGVYCFRFRDTLAYFAGQERPDGSLLFGVSDWDPRGHNTSVYGVAKPAPHGWIYEEQVDAPDPAARCKLSIVREKGGSVKVAVDEKVRCYGGQSELYILGFPRASYQRRVTHELADAEAFQRNDVCREPAYHLKLKSWPDAWQPPEVLEMARPRK
jgi:hypothetical protein